jgi:hypothetical protein
VLLEVCKELLEALELVRALKELVEPPFAEGAPLEVLELVRVLKELVVLLEEPVMAPETPAIALKGLMEAPDGLLAPLGELS